MIVWRAEQDVIDNAGVFGAVGGERFSFNDHCYVGPRSEISRNTFYCHCDDVYGLAIEEIRT